MAGGAFQGKVVVAICETDICSMAWLKRRIGCCGGRCGKPVHTKSELLMVWGYRIPIWALARETAWSGWEETRESRMAPLIRTTRKSMACELE